MNSTMQSCLLPPLILHPFCDVNGPAKLAQSSQASLMLQGLVPAGATTADELEQTLLTGRFCELRMLYYVGKDIVRWIEQCVDCVQRDPDRRRENLSFESFAHYLTQGPPLAVRDKLAYWGVADYQSIFSRALALNTLFREIPDLACLSPEFVRNYYRYADTIYNVRVGTAEFAALPSSEFAFELYASGEYSRMLEREWQD